ncbi:MAG TPA: alpha/beta hydrolase [Nitrososphaeraceae archaeon]|nr:alpha/beta hydrolase [Nitrososphaeraceae archaeon]
MYYPKKSKEVLCAIFLFALIIPTSIIATITPLVYAQTNQSIADNEDLLNMQDIPAKKVHVGDIDIAYKMFGKGDPILLISGGSTGINGWVPSTLKALSSNHTVIVFDTRGIGNTTIGSKSYTMEQLANDTAGLLDALKIGKANVLGYSLGSSIAQKFAVMHPEKINSLILVAATCGGKEGIPQPTQLVKLQSEILNKSLNNIPIAPEKIKSLISLSLGTGWLRLHPDDLQNIPKAEDVFAGVPPNTIKGQFSAGEEWMATNWSGACNELAKIAKPTLVITGTDDNSYIPHANSLIIAGKIPGAWLIQIKDAGHAVLSQYPDEIDRVLQTFLSTTTNPPS